MRGYSVHGYSMHDRLFDYEICSLLCLPCMPIKEMVGYGYVICSIEVYCALVYNSFDNGTIKGKSINGTRDMVENLGCPAKLGQLATMSISQIRSSISASGCIQNILLVLTR